MIKKILTASITGDALGTPFDGMNRPHIDSSFKNINSYTDTLQALKGKTFKWAKPGLYSSISQIQLITLISFRRSRFRLKSLISALEKMPEIQDHDYSILRHPGRLEKNIFSRIRSMTDESSVSTSPSARIIPSCAAFSFADTKDDQKAENTISFIREFTHDIPTLCGGLFLVRLLSMGLFSNTEDKSILSLSIDASRETENFINEKSARLFDLGMNPDYLANEQSRFTEIFEKCTKTDTEDEAEEFICNVLNRSLKTPVKRATVDHPLAIIPFAVFLTDSSNKSSENILFRAVRKGGSASALTALTGIMASCFNKDFNIPQKLVDDLVNRKRILNLLETVPSLNGSEKQMDEFLETEAMLTTKEHEELSARTRHQKSTNVKKKKDRREKEQDLAKITIESWTKIDKARWKKEQKKLKNDDN